MLGWLISLVKNENAIAIAALNLSYFVKSHKVHPRDSKALTVRKFLNLEQQN